MNTVACVLCGFQKPFAAKNGGCINWPRLGYYLLLKFVSCILYDLFNIWLKFRFQEVT